MSKKIDCMFGYGFKVYVSDEELKRFILKHKDVISSIPRGKELLEYIEKCSDDEFNPKEDFYDWENENSNYSGIYGMIADVMCKETGIVFGYLAGQNDEDDVIVFPEMYPWEMNDTEKLLTEEELEAIYKRYIDDLGGQLVVEYICSDI